MKKVDFLRIYEINLMLVVRLYFKDDKNEESFKDFYYEDYIDRYNFIEAVEEYLNLNNIAISEAELKNLKILVSIYYYEEDKYE